MRVVCLGMVLGTLILRIVAVYIDSFKWGCRCEIRKSVFTVAEVGCRVRRIRILDIPVWVGIYKGTVKS